MAAQKGREVLLKIGGTDSSTPFVTIGGFTTNDLALSEGEVDVTTKDTENPHWQQLLAGGGAKSLRLSGDGIFKDTTGEQTLLTAASQQSNHYWFQMVVPSLANFEAPCLISELRYGGGDQDGANFGLTLMSAGDVTITTI